MSDETPVVADNLPIADTAPVAAAAPSAPTLALDPTSGLDGASARLTASGFEPESWVSVFAGLRWLFNTRVSEHGTFGASFGVTRSAGPGEVKIVAQAYAPRDDRDPSNHVVERDIDATPLASASFTIEG